MAYAAISETVNGAGEMLNATGRTMCSVRGTTM